MMLEGLPPNFAKFAGERHCWNLPRSFVLSDTGYWWIKIAEGIDPSRDLTFEVSTIYIYIHIYIHTYIYNHIYAIDMTAEG